MSFTSEADAEKEIVGLYNWIRSSRNSPDAPHLAGFLAVPVEVVQPRPGEKVKLESVSTAYGDLSLRPGEALFPCFVGKK